MTFGGASVGTNTMYKVGDYGPGGGAVIYDAGSYQSWGRYIECYPLSAFVGGGQWSPLGATVSGLVNTLGSSQTNTDLMIAADSSANSAAVKCRNYTGGGYTNWSLPCFGEAATQVFNARFDILAKFGYFSGIYYWWASQQVDATNAYAFASFTGGSVSFAKTNNQNFFAVRYF